MHTFILQDYTTIRGNNNTVTQNESGWLDLSSYQDVIVWLDIRELTGIVTMNIQTSPSKDDTLFQTMVSPTVAVGVPAPSKVMAASATVPLARYVRWVLTSSSAPFDLTFRIYLAANSPGM